MLIKIEVLYLFIFTTLIPQTCSNNNAALRFGEAYALSAQTLRSFLQIFLVCAESSIPSQKFLVEDLKSFVNYPPKTTVGFAPRFTSNRKFFANMISTKAFKEMLARDEDEIRKNFIKKLKYCDDVAMDENIIKDLYDREVDGNKL